MYKIAIIGLGPAGIFTLSLLPTELLSEVIVFEPAAIGGALATDYGAVIANIPKSVIVDAFEKIPRWAGKPLKHLEKYAPTDCPVLNDVVRQLRELIAPDLTRIIFHSARVTGYKRTSASAWQLTTSSGLFEAQKLVLCIGATPKTLDLPKPIIPLSIALNPAALPNFVIPTDRIVVFGTAHSGTLALRNLRNAGVTALTGVYKGTTPFLFARDGFSEGIKQESATIADDLLAHSWATLLPNSDFATTYRAVYEATAVVYAIGFERPAPVYDDGAGDPKPLFGAQDVYGFGIGFPSTYTGPDGKLYPDVGFGGFINAIKAALPSLLTFVP